MSGVMAIARKELLEAIGSAATEKGTRFIALLVPLMVALFAISAYLNDPRFWAWGAIVFMPAMASFMAVFYAAESISGERERHTLETLLSAPVSEHTILLGKVVAHFIMTVGFAVVALIITWLSVLPFAGEHGVWAPPAGALFYTALLTLHIFFFSEAVGIFVGQRAETVAGGNAMIVPIFILPAMILGFSPVLGQNIDTKQLQDLSRFIPVLVHTILLMIYIALLILVPLILRKNQARRLLKT